MDDDGQVSFPARNKQSIQHSMKEIKIIVGLINHHREQLKTVIPRDEESSEKIRLAIKKLTKRKMDIENLIAEQIIEEEEEEREAGGVIAQEEEEELGTNGVVAQEEESETGGIIAQEKESGEVVRAETDDGGDKESKTLAAKTTEVTFPARNRQSIQHSKKEIKIIDRLINHHLELLRTIIPGDEESLERNRLAIEKLKKRKVDIENLIAELLIEEIEEEDEKEEPKAGGVIAQEESETGGVIAQEKESGEVTRAETDDGRDKKSKTPEADLLTNGNVQVLETQVRLNRQHPGKNICHISAKGMTSSAFPLQVGSISPDFIQPMQMPAPRTSSALSNLDEQKHDVQVLCDGLKSIQVSDTPKEENNRNEDALLIPDPVNLADKPADHVAKHLRSNRAKIKKVLASEASYPEMNLNVKKYLRNVDLNLELLKDKKDLEEELKVLRLVRAKFELKHEELCTAGVKAELSCYRTAKKILTMHGLEDVLNMDPEILKDNWILSRLKTPEKIKKHLFDVKNRENDLEEMLLDDTKTKLNAMWNQREMEESQLADLYKPQENTEAMKASIMSLSERLALQTSEMNHKDNIIADSRSLLNEIKHSLNRCYKLV